jgi:hypothetical protein
MALGVRARSQSVEIDLALIGFYVLLEGLQVEHQGWRRQFPQAARLSYQSRVGSGKTVHFIH